MHSNHPPAAPVPSLPTRRDALRTTFCCCLGCLALGGWRVAGSAGSANKRTADADDSLSAADGDGDDHSRPFPPRTPADVAAFVCRWELSALHANWPARYRRHFRWSRAIRWLPDFTVCYGVGAGIHETAVDLALARIRLAELGRGPVLAEHVADGDGDGAPLSAWSLVIGGADDCRLRAAMRGLTPVWWRSFDADFGSAADVERALRMRAARREGRRREAGRRQAPRREACIVV